MHLSPLGCPIEFLSAKELYCEGQCGQYWFDKARGCQDTDADVFCRLSLCEEMAYAVKYKVATVSDVPGFACAGRGYNYGNWVGFVDIHFTKSMKETHGFGQAIAHVVCAVTSNEMRKNITKRAY